MHIVQIFIIPQRKNKCIRITGSYYWTELMIFACHSLPRLHQINHTFYTSLHLQNHEFTQVTVAIECYYIAMEIVLSTMSDKNLALSDAPLQSKLLELLEPLDKWEVFGSYLPGISSTVIENIKQTVHERREQKKLLVLKFCQLPLASWEQVILALIKAEESKIACYVLQNCTKSTKSSIDRLKGKK